MIAVREGPNVRLGVDAVQGRYRSDAWRVDAFVARPTETPPGVLGNGWMPGVPILRRSGTPVLGIPLGSGLHLRLKGHAFWRMRPGDAIYAIWGAPLRTASTTKARFVGAMPEGMLTWTAGRHLRLALEGSHFLPGPVLRESGPDRGLTHVGLRAKYVF